MDETSNLGTKAPRQIDELNENYFLHAKNLKLILISMPDFEL